MSSMPNDDSWRPISGPYRGYDQRGAPEPEWDLVRTGPGTKMGEHMRRFWQPVCLTSQLTDVPLLVKILGEELVVFKDKRGRIGALHKHCCHRGTSLEYGRIEECGIRCCYHGWLFDVDGTTLETPGEPESSRLRNAVYQGAYPALDYHGLVHIYMGPPELKPPFPEFDIFKIPGLRYYPSTVVHSNNWLQSFENNMDPYHGQFLHTRNTPHFGDHYFVLPQVEWKLTNDGKGIYYSACRRVDDDTMWIRLFHCMFPNYVFVASLFDLKEDVPHFQRTFWARRVVPNDDEHCTFFSWRLAADEGEFEGGDVSRNGINSIDFDGQVEQPTYELKQRAPGDWEAQGGQRAIAVHRLERLGTTDAGIVRLRQALRKALAGESPDTVPPAAGALGSVDAEPVYSSNNTIKLKRLADPKADLEQTRAVSRELQNAVIEAGGLPWDQRQARISQAIQEIEKRHA